MLYYRQTPAQSFRLTSGWWVKDLMAFEAREGEKVATKDLNAPSDLRLKRGRGKRWRRKIRMPPPTRV